MIPAGMQIFVAVDPIDLRWSFDRLAGLVQDRVGYAARCGALFCFFGKRRDALKILFFDGTGLCLFYKRLDRGTFKLPEPLEGQAHVEVDDAALSILLDGVDVARPREPKRRRVRLH